MRVQSDKSCLLIRAHQTKQIRCRLEIPEVAGAVLCHACGLHQACFGRPRPAAFVPVDDDDDDDDDDNVDDDGDD